MCFMNDKKYVSVEHALPPIWDSNSKILILGTMPSPKSRENGFYYAHPQNRFWRIMENLFSEALTGNKEKTAFLLNHGIALWDVIKSCDIVLASDSSIKNVVPNDLKIITENCDIKMIFTTGLTAHKLYNKFCYPAVKREDICFSSTSPANARKTLADLTEEYKVILNYL